MSPIILVAAMLITSPLQSIDPEETTYTASIDVDQCRPTFCEAWELADEGTLLCFDTDEAFGAGHWAFDIGPDQGDLQVTVEY